MNNSRAKEQSVEWTQDRAVGRRFIHWASPAARHFLLLFIGTAAFGQAGLQDIFYTAATTHQRPGGSHWAYLVFDATTPALVTGKQYAIYKKPGSATNSALYERVAFVQRQTDPRVINVLLNRSLNLGENTNELNDSITKLFQTMTNAMALPLPEKISAVIRGSTGKAEFEANLRLLAKVHPAVAMSLGLAHAEIISGPPVTNTTFEIRQYDPARGLDLGVVGRVTVTAGAPPVLPAPGPPVRLPELNPRGHLNAKLRWATPDDLRRLSLLNFGFNVWRMTRAVSEANGIGTNAPSLATLMSLKASRPSEVKQVNQMPALKSRDFDSNTVANVTPPTGDTNTFFFADDNDRFHGGMNFNDGEEFYYYVTARDILGRDGQPSPGTLVMMCSLLPPYAPTDVKVDNDYSYTGGPKQVLKVSWRQAENSSPTYTNASRTNIVAYYVYRWSNQVEMLANEANAEANRIAIVPYQANTNVGSYIDDRATNSPVMPADASRTFWYTVRALDGGACTNNPSPHSGMAYGVLRDRVGPPAPSGGIVINCPNAVATYLDRSEGPDPDADAANSRFLLQCTRQHAQLAWAEFKVHVSSNLSLSLPADMDYDLGRVEFGADGKALIDYSLPYAWTGTRVTVTCRVGASDEIVSAWATTEYQTWPAAGNRLTLLFSGRIEVNGTRVDNPMPVRLSPPVFFSFPPVINETYVVLYTPGVNAGVGRVQASRDLRTWIDLTNAPITTITIPILGWTFGPLFAVLDPAIFTERQRFYRVLPASYTVPVPCDHFPYPGNNTGATNTDVRINLPFTPTTKEYKIYRRVDDGALTLLAQGRGDYSAGRLSTQRVDEALPAGASKVCYFAQLFDEHGNPSPLTPLGDCVTPVRTPPCPVLSGIEPVFTNNKPMALLRWACPTEGVERFRIYVALKQGEAFISLSEDAAGNDFSALNVNAPKRLQASAGLDPMGHVVRPKETYKGSYATDRIGGSIGAGPQFSTLINVAEGTDYFIKVQAVSPGNVESKGCLPARPFKWNPPPPAQQTTPFPQVQWPARPLPATNSSALFTAELMPVSRNSDQPPVTTLAALDPVYPVGMKIGQVKIAPVNQHFGMGHTNAIPTSKEPVSLLSEPPGQSGSTVFPVVLYRTQVPSAAFPLVSGDVVQCSPLMEKIAYSFNHDAIDLAQIKDPFVRVLYSELGLGEPLSESILLTSDIYLLDTQPVLAGATYHYMLVRFDPVTHEVDQTISAGNITIPAN